MKFDNWIDQAATVDVLSTIRWLGENGFDESSRVGGPDAGFGNIAFSFESEAVEIRITRDRGQWECYFRFPESGEAFGIGLVSDVRRGVADWIFPSSAGFPEQLPKGVLWASEVPRCLSWLSVTDDALAMLAAEDERRSTLLRLRHQPPTST